jgi:hypothetical protein
MTTDQKRLTAGAAHIGENRGRLTATRTIKGIVIAGALAGAMLAFLGQAAASPPTTTDTHGGSNSRVQLSGDDYRSSTQSMPQKRSVGRWANQAEWRQPIIFARPQRTAG